MHTDHTLSVPSAVQPMIPRGEGWHQVPLPGFSTLGYPGQAWEHPRHHLLVISAVEVASQADDLEPECVYHVSLSCQKKGRCRRCTPEQARFVLQAFDMKGALEDNHVPFGKVRNYWRPVAEAEIGRECACVADEPAIREDKGSYVWRG